ncbi:MAG: peptidoglycan-associated lipoprotein Pal [Pseudomonadota bacterium]
MTTTLRATPYFAAIFCVALLAGCSTTDETTPGTGAGTGGDGAAGAGGINDITSVEYFNVVVGDRVFFDTDRFDLDSAAQTVLGRQAEWLLANPGATATIEGHADERGTRDYNLALGARRASSVASFLISRGVEANRLQTVSFGKERPVSLCSDESCWSQNRRGVTVVLRGPVS